MKYQKYSDVPFYRKNIVFILIAILFAPAALPIILTGNVYFEKNGELTEYTKFTRIASAIILILCTLYFLSGFIG